MEWVRTLRGTPVDVERQRTPMTPEINRWKYGIRFQTAMVMQGNTATPREVGEIGDKISPEPQVVAILFYCMNVCVIVVMNEWTLYL